MAGRRKSSRTAVAENAENPSLNSTVGCLKIVDTFRNVHDPAGQATYCHACVSTLIGRDWYDITVWNVSADGGCGTCGARCRGCLKLPPVDGGAAVRR